MLVGALCNGSDNDCPFHIALINTTLYPLDWNVIHFSEKFMRYILNKTLCIRKGLYILQRQILQNLTVTDTDMIHQPREHCSYKTL